MRGFESAGMIWATILDLLVSGEEPISGAFGGNGKTVTGRKPLGKGLSSYQLFRAALDFLGKSDGYMRRVPYADCSYLKLGMIGRSLVSLSRAKMVIEYVTSH